MNPDDFLEAITAVGERALQLGDHELICSLIAVGHTTRWFPAALYGELRIAEAAGKAAGKDWDDNPPIEIESAWTHGRAAALVDGTATVDLRVLDIAEFGRRRFVVKNADTNFGTYRWRWMAMRRMRAIARYHPAEDI